MTFEDVLRQAILELKQAGIENPGRDARLLMAQASGLTQADLIASSGDELTESQTAVFYTYVKRRSTGEPVSRISGQREFWGRMFRVTPDVLDPRPDTEIVVDTCLEKLSDERSQDILDMGTGSGCILLTLLAERRLTRGIGLDASRDALQVAEQNARMLDLGERAGFLVSDWFAQLNNKQRFDLIVSNPPYIPDEDIAVLDRDVRDFDPHLALFGGVDGLNPYREIIESAPDFLKTRANLVFEVGIYQADAVAEMMKKRGFSEINVRKDINGVKRCVYGCWLGV